MLLDWHIETVEVHFLVKINWSWHYDYSPANICICEISVLANLARYVTVCRRKPLLPVPSKSVFDSFGLASLPKSPETDPGEGQIQGREWNWIIIRIEINPKIFGWRLSATRRSVLHRALLLVGRYRWFIDRPDLGITTSSCALLDNHAIFSLQISNSLKAIIGSITFVSRLPVWRRIPASRTTWIPASARPVPAYFSPPRRRVSRPRAASTALRATSGITRNAASQIYHLSLSLSVLFSLSASNSYWTLSFSASLCRSCFLTLATSSMSLIRSFCEIAFFRLIFTRLLQISG